MNTNAVHVWIELASYVGIGRLIAIVLAFSAVWFFAESLNGPWKWGQRQ